MLDDAEEKGVKTDVAEAVFESLTHEKAMAIPYEQREQLLQGILQGGSVEDAQTAIKALYDHHASMAEGKKYLDELDNTGSKML